MVVFLAEMELWRFLAGVVLVGWLTARRILQLRKKRRKDSSKAEYAKKFAAVPVVSSLQLPPGPSGVPVLGCLLHLLGEGRPEEKLTKLSRQYGPVMWMQVGGVPTLVISSPDMARLVLKEQDKLFSYRRKDSPQYALSQLLYYGTEFFNPHGPAWKFQVKKLMRMEFLTEKQMGKYQAVREEEFGYVTGFVRDIVEAANLESAAVAIDLKAVIAAAYLNNATRSCWSRRYCNVPDATTPGRTPDLAVLLETLQEWLATYYWLAYETLELLSDVLIRDVLPSLSFLDLIVNRDKMRRIKESFARLDTFFQGLLANRRAQPLRHDDMLDALLHWTDDHGQQLHLSDTTIKGGFQFALIGLTETVSTSSEWAMAELIAHPHHLQEVHRELDEVVGRDRTVQESDLANLPFLRAVIKEVWRMHPSPPLGAPHSNPVDAEVAGYRVPADTNVLINVYGIGRDPAVWPEPDEFRPHRFLEGTHAHIEGNGQHMELLTFSAGTRLCPGVKLAPRMEGLLLARLLHSFDWRAPEDRPLQDLVRTVPHGQAHRVDGPLMAVPSLRLPPHLYSTHRYRRADGGEGSGAPPPAGFLSSWDASTRTMEAFLFTPSSFQ